MAHKGRAYHEDRGEDENKTYPGDDGEFMSFQEVDEFEDPVIQHDHGFMEGWDDHDGDGFRNEDDYEETRTHARDESLSEDPTWADYVALAKWTAMLEGAELLRPDLVDATATYRHFLFGGGAQFTFDYDRFLTGDSAGAVIEEAVLVDAEIDVFDAYMQSQSGAAVAPAPTESTSAPAESTSAPAESTTAPSSSNTTTSAGPESTPTSTLSAATFQMQSDPVTVGGEGRYPYPGTENWQKAVGGHPRWVELNATVTPDEAAGETIMELNLGIKAEDMYNFNPGQSDITTGLKDAENGRLAVVGLGHEFLQRGEASRQTVVRRPIGDMTGTERSPEVSGANNRAQERLPEGSRGNPAAR